MVFSVEIFNRLVRLRSGCNNDNAVPDFDHSSIPRHGNLRLEIPERAFHFSESGIRIDTDVSVGRYRWNQPSQRLPRIFAVEQVVHFLQIAAKFSFLFDKVDDESLICERERRRHARHTPADHQSVMRNIEWARIERIVELHLR